MYLLEAKQAWETSVSAGFLQSLLQVLTTQPLAIVRAPQQ